MSSRAAQGCRCNSCTDLLNPRSLQTTTVSIFMSLLMEMSCHNLWFAHLYTTAAMLTAKLLSQIDLACRPGMVGVTSVDSHW